MATISPTGIATVASALGEPAVAADTALPIAPSGIATAASAFGTPLSGFGRFARGAWAVSNVGAASGAAYVQRNPVPNARLIVTGYRVSTSGAAVAAAGALLTIKSGSTILWRDSVSAAHPATEHRFQVGLRCAPGEPAILEVAAAGTDVVISASMEGNAGA